MLYIADDTTKFIIMCDIEKRAKEIVEETIKTKGEFGGYTFAAGLIGYTYQRHFWKEAKKIGFKRQEDGRLVGFVSSHNGTLAVAEDAYVQALKEKKAEIAKTGATGSFLDNVYLYTYLT